MSGVQLSSGDLAKLKTLVADLDFDDAERRAALLESKSRDFNAVPGSGKTSLLAAKLMLLAQKWPHTRCGICVLSHTNVAREEIANRLVGSVDSAKLLSYPHFIGTIHSFANHFFSLPLLRSLGMKIDVIDDQVFAEKARYLLKLKSFSGLRFYLDKQMNGDDIATTLFYRTAELKVHVERGSLPASHTKSYESLMAIKEKLTAQGIFRHRDMFAFTELALQICPRLVDIVHRRFPMVFIDEMQDTSWEQEFLLNRIFDGRSVMQRFGDIDQKILSDEDGSEQLTFPRTGHGRISTSKRFGKSISDAVGCVRVSGENVLGEGADAHPPVLLLYKTNQVTKVVTHFGQMVIDKLNESEIGTLGVKVMSARKTGESNVDAGRHLLDYVPYYDGEKLSDGVRSENFWSLIGTSKGTLKQASLNSRVLDVRRAILLVLRSAGAEIAEDIRDARSLSRVANAVVPTGAIDKLTRQLALDGERMCIDNQRNELMELLYTQLNSFLPVELDPDKFKRLSVFQGANEVPAFSSITSTRFVVIHKDRNLDIGIGTIAGMKGETHVASLILESYGGSSRKFDISLALEYIAGSNTKSIAKLPKTQRAQMRNIYVAMSRPTQFLCLAANENRVSQTIRDKMKSQGWHIEEVN